MRWPWSRSGAPNGHAHPDVERASAELFGRLSTLTDELEAVVRSREVELEREEQAWQAQEPPDPQEGP